MILQSDGSGWIFDTHLDAGLLRFMDGILNQLQKQDVVESFHYRTAFKKKIGQSVSHVATVAAKSTAVHNGRTGFYQRADFIDLARTKERGKPLFIQRWVGLGAVILHNSSTVSDRWQRYLSARAYTQILSLPPSLSANPVKIDTGPEIASGDLATLFLRAENLQTQTNRAHRLH